MIDDARAARLMELLDCRQRGTLTPEQSHELEAHLSPALDEALDETLDRAIDHFDFDRARRAMEQRLRADRVAMRMGAAMLSLVLLVAAVLALRRGDWGALVFTASAQALVPLAWYLMTARRRASAKAALAGRLPVEHAFAEHRRASVLEWVMLRAIIIVGGIGMAVLAIDGARSGDLSKLGVGVLNLLVFGPILWRRCFSVAGQRRHHAFIEGRVGASAWRGAAEGASS